MTSSKPKRKLGIVAIGCAVSVIGGAVLLLVANNDPEWAQHATQADFAYSNNDFPRMDKEVQELLKYSADGSVPQNIPTPWLAYVFPMQDLQEELTYSGRLRQLAKDYSYAKRPQDAEKLFRLTLDLDKKKYGEDSTTVVRDGYSGLIDNLKEQNKMDEVKKLREERIRILEKMALKHPNYYDGEISSEKQVLLEESGDVSKAEDLLKQRIAAAEKSDDMSEAAMERVRKFNDDNKGQVTTSLRFVRELEELAEFYDRYKMYDKEIAVIQRAQDLRIKTHGSPDEIGDAWRDLSQCYEKLGQFRSAADALTHEIDLYQSNGRRQSSLDWSRKKRDELLAKAKEQSTPKQK